MEPAVGVCLSFFMIFSLVILVGDKLQPSGIQARMEKGEIQERTRSRAVGKEFGIVEGYSGHEARAL